MSQVGFFTILDPFKSDNTSGGPQAYKNIIRHIESLGYSVNVITPESEYRSPSEFSFNVYQYIFNDPGGSPWFSMDQLREMGSTKTPYMFSECAYTACTTSPYGDTRYKGQDLSPISRNLMIGARRFITASPLHGENISRLIGHDLKNFYHYLCEVDTERFKNLNQDREIEYITVGAMNIWKGTDFVCQKYGRDLTVIGYGHEGLLVNNANFVGKIPHEETHTWYNKSKNFVHLPNWKESFSITTAEASLCGCKVITNENVGANSFNKDLSNPDTYKESGEDFKEMLLNEFGKA